MKLLTNSQRKQHTHRVLCTTVNREWLLHLYITTFIIIYLKNTSLWSFIKRWVYRPFVTFKIAFFRVYFELLGSHARFTSWSKKELFKACTFTHAEEMCI